MDPRGAVGSIYKGEYYTLVQTTYESFALGHMVSEKIFLCFFFPIVSLRELLTPPPPPPRDGAISNPRGMLGRIYVKLHITMLHAKYRSFGCCGFREEDFFSPAQKPRISAKACNTVYRKSFRIFLKRIHHGDLTVNRD